MRTKALLAGLLLSGTAVPVSATTIVQTDNEAIARGFAGFDPALGTLNSVTLDINLFRLRAWQVSVQSAVPTSISLGWTINGAWQLPASTGMGGAGAFVPLTGSGNLTVALNNVQDGRAFGVFGVDARGTGSLSLDPATFIGIGRILYNGFDPGFFAPGDTSFTGAGSASLIHLASGCPSGGSALPQAEDLCGSARYTLTYNYTPAVPEPGTWGMMLVGFAAVGRALRHQRRKLATA